MYDRNGLALNDTNRETYNSYKYTAIQFKEKKFSAYALSSKHNVWNYCMHTMKMYDDPRDAAFVAQEFRKVYDPGKVSDLINAGDFREVVNDFINNLEIPEWKYPAEGLTITELLGEDKIYKQKVVNNAREALLEAFDVFNIKQRPSLEVAKKLISQVESLYKEGMTYRQAASTVIQQS